MMDGWMSKGFCIPFNSISVISRRWKDEYERLFAMKRSLRSPLKGHELSQVFVLCKMGTL